MAGAVNSERGAAAGATSLRIVDQLDVAVIVCDLENRVVRWNRHAEELYGWSADEALGRSVRALTMEPDAEEQAAALADIVASGAEWTGTVPVRRRDGSGLLVELRLTPWRVDGEHAGAIGVSVDVTERVLALRRLAAHHAVSRAIAEERPPAEVCEALLRGAAEALFADAGHVWHVQDGVLRLLCSWPHGAAAPAPPTAEQADAGGAPGGRALHVLRREGRPRLVVELHGPGPPGGGDPAELLDALGGQVLEYLARLEGSSALHLSNQRAAFLADASAALAESLDYGQTLAAVARLAVPSLADWCAIDVLSDDGAIERAAVVHQDPEQVEWAKELQRRLPPDPSAETGVPKVLRTGEPELHPTIPQELLAAALEHRPELREILDRLGLVSLIVVPLVARGRPLGAMTLVTAESGRVYGQEDLALATEFGRRAGLAIENARLYLAQAETRERLQHALLPPRLPLVPSANVAASYRPGARDAEIGGDFYDLFEQDGGWFVVVGDVCGKGLAAASTAGLVRHAIRTAAVVEASPARILQIANRAVAAAETNAFATVVCARLRPEADGSLSVAAARAGHPPPLVARPDGDVRELEAGGLPLGVLPAERYDEEELELEPGDALVLYTDGISERRDGAGFFGAAGVRRAAAAGGDADAIVRRIEDEAFRFGGPAEAHDDAAVVVLQPHLDGLDRSELVLARTPSLADPPARTTLVLPREPAAIGHARAALERHAASLPEDAVADLRLIASELVTNAVVHGDGDALTFTVEAAPAAVRCAVSHAGRAFELRPPGRPPGPDHASGRGLFIVSRLADRLGLDGDEGVTVWAERRLDRR